MSTQAQAKATIVRVPGADLPTGGQILVRAGSRQIAVFRLESGDLYAVDNQCPHEGYPLVKGTVKDCILTCLWHNYKFRLQDGACLMGDEAVRTFPVREVDDRIEVEVVEPPAAEQIPRYLCSLEEGLQEYRMGQVARDTVRLLKLGRKPEEIAFQAARYDAEHAEFGTSHALPLTVDVLPYMKRYPGVQAIYPLMQVLEMAAEPHIRRPPRPTPEPADPGPDPQQAGKQLAHLVENEDLEAAEALLRGALSRSWSRDVIEPWLYAACTRHFLNFGHALIYQVKIFDLLDVVGWQHATDLLPAHLVRIINATREDLLPEWQWFRTCMEDVEPRLPQLYAAQQATKPGKVGDLADTILDGSREGAFEAITDSLERSVLLPDIVNALSVAASERMLRFNAAIDSDRTVQDDWLDVTHLLTFANALRHAVQRHPYPDILRSLYYGARFINNAKPLDLPPAERLETGTAGAASLADLSTAVDNHHAQTAINTLNAHVTATDDLTALRAFCEDLALADNLTRPIVVAHLIKTCAAAFEETQSLQTANHPDATHPLRAFIRLAASPIRERNISRLTHEAIRFVEEGKVPRALT